MTKRTQAFDAVKAIYPDIWNRPGATTAMDALVDLVEPDASPRPQVSAAPVFTTKITERIQLEILEHEGIVLEAYKDSVGIWTWGGGVTDHSGHKVARYKDNPSTLVRALEVYEWLLRTVYLPDVLKAFEGHPLTEAQLGAALSFHWNTGAVLEANWVKHYRAGDIQRAKEAFMNWSSPPEIIGRRQGERNLFFDGKWSSDGMVLVYGKVLKPSYRPSGGKVTDIRAELRDVVARAGQ